MIAYCIVKIDTLVFALQAHWIYAGVTVESQWSHNGVTMESQWSCIGSRPRAVLARGGSESVSHASALGACCAKLAAAHLQCCCAVHICAKVRRARATGGLVARRIAACFAALLAWRAVCSQWCRLRACMLGRDRACLPAIAIAFVCSCAWLACSVICANCAPRSNAGSNVCHMVCGMRACWVKLNQ